MGGGGPDLLRGGPGRDDIHGGGDADSLYGADGDDVLLGGAGDLTTLDRLALAGTVRLAIERFILDEDEAPQEEFRQLLKSFLRFYAFVAQVVSCM